MMWGETVFIFIQMVKLFFVLLITGRIYTYFTNDVQATLWEDVQASALISIIIFAATVIAFYCNGGFIFINLLYIALIYKAFQFEGLHHFISFCCIHLLVNLVLTFCGITMFYEMLLPPSENMAG